MKVIQELIAYFDRQGKLSKAQLKRLLSQGYLAQEAPETMVGLCDRVGQSYYFRLVGQVQGAVWGSDTYTADSQLATAAVHAGLIKPGEAGIVKVTVVKDLAKYPGGKRNGVTSSPYGPYPGAYELSKI